MKSYKPIVIGATAVIVIAGLYLIGFSINARLANKRVAVNTQTNQPTTQAQPESGGQNVPPQGFAPEFTAKVGGKSYVANKRFPMSVFDGTLVAYNATGILTVDVDLINLYPTFEKRYKTTSFKVTPDTEIFFVDMSSKKSVKKSVTDLLPGSPVSIIIPDIENNRDILTTDIYSAKTISMAVNRL